MKTLCILDKLYLLQDIKIENIISKDDIKIVKGYISKEEIYNVIKVLDMFIKNCSYIPKQDPDKINNSYFLSFFQEYFIKNTSFSSFRNIKDLEKLPKDHKIKLKEVKSMNF